MSDYLRLEIYDEGNRATGQQLVIPTHLIPGAWIEGTRKEPERRDDEDTNTE